MNSRHVLPLNMYFHSISIKNLAHRAGMDNITVLMWKLSRTDKMLFLIRSYQLALTHLARLAGQQTPGTALPPLPWPWMAVITAAPGSSHSSPQVCRESSLPKRVPALKVFSSYLLYLKNHFHYKSLKVIILFCQVVTITTNAYIILNLL